MMPRFSLMFGALLALLAAQAGAATAASLDPRLSELAMLAMHDLPGAEAKLKELAQSPEGREHPDTLHFAAGLIDFESGDTVGAEKQAELLSANPDTLAQGLLLRARVAARQAHLVDAANLAQQSLNAQAGACQVGEEAQALDKGCDALAAEQALSVLVNDRTNRGAAADASNLGRRGLALAQAAGNRFDQISLLGQLALAALAQDTGTDSQQWIGRMSEVAGDDPLLLAQARSYESVIASQTGDKAVQHRALLDSLSLARKADATLIVARSQGNLGDYFMKSGQTALGVEATHEALQVFQRIGDVTHERTYRHNLAVMLIQQHHFDAARREMAFVEALRKGQPDTTQRIRELRELDEAWTAAGQPREAIALFHAERTLTEQANTSNRDAQMAELRLKYDTTRKQRDLELLMRDQSLKDQQLGNRQLAQRVGIAAAALLFLATILGVLMVRRVRAAQQRLKAHQALLRAASERDPLTDLANRRHFLAVMERMSGTGFEGALLMVDIDHFKQINDGHGHASGDVVICEVSRRLVSAVRGGDLVVRWGGEEFLIFAPNANATQLATLAERVLDCIGMDPVMLESGALRVTTSVGFAHFPLPAPQSENGQLSVHWEHAVNWVDMALYTAKSQGRNRAVGIAQLQARDAQEMARVEADFETACNTGQVELREVIGP